MAVPGGPGGQLGLLESDPRTDTPRVPSPPPDRGRNAGRVAITLFIAALIVAVLIALL